MKTQNTILKRMSEFMNPYLLITEKGNKEINNIVFYNSETGKELLSEGNTNIRWFGSNNEFPEMQFNFAEPRRKNEVDLKSVAPFYVAYKSRLNFYKDKIVLYIPIQKLENFKYLGILFDFETDIDKKSLPTYSFDVQCSKINLHKCKKTAENKLNGYEYRTSEVKKHTIKFNDYCVTELKPLGEKLEKLYEAAKSAKMDVSKYDIEKMLNVFEITIK